jgi:hypothetical protein
MSVATLERPNPVEEPLRSPRTLEDLVSVAWDRLAAGAAVTCPVCDGDMRPGPHATGSGACASCGSRLT